MQFIFPRIWIPESEEIKGAESDFSIKTDPSFKKKKKSVSNQIFKKKCIQPMIFSDHVRMDHKGFKIPQDLTIKKIWI